MKTGCGSFKKEMNEGYSKLSVLNNFAEKELYLMLF